jgi:hypothetical protein
MLRFEMEDSTTDFNKLVIAEKIIEIRTLVFLESFDRSVKVLLHNKPSI